MFNLTPMKRYLCVCKHTHRFGETLLLAHSDRKLNTEDFIKQFDICFEPDRGEFIEVDIYAASIIPTIE